MSITKQTPELYTIVENDKFVIEEVLSEIEGLQHVMFVKGLMTVDEIIFAVKKYEVSEVHYTVGTDKTHTFPLVMKTRRECFKGQDCNFKFDVDKAQTMYPVIHKMFYDGKDWKYVYNHEI